jgi:preprotein translocase subunit SecD
MSKRIRFVLLLLVIAIAGLLLYPTVNWYFMVPEDVLSGTPTDPGRQRN